MKRTSIRLLLATCVSFSLVSCMRTEIEIFPGFNQGVLVINETDTLHIKSDSVIIYEMPLGTNSIVFNNQESQKFRVSNKGGVLNLSNQRLLRTTATYTESGRGSNSLAVLDDMYNMVSIDSTIYYLNHNEKKISDEKILKMYTFFFRDKKIGGRSKSFMKLYEKTLFTQKDWDYGISEEAPESIEINQYDTDRVRTKLVGENWFKIAALFKPNYIKSVPLRELEGKVTMHDLLMSK